MVVVGVSVPGGAGAVVAELGLEEGYGRRGEREGGADMGRRWRAWWRLGERVWW